MADAIATSKLNNGKYIPTLYPCIPTGKALFNEII
jgi:hypothetical protein